MHLLQSCRLKTILCLGCFFPMLLLSAHVVAGEADTNAVPLPKELISPHTVWGEERNGIRAGVDWEVSGGMNVQVVVLTFKTNAAWHYVAPHGKKFMTFELRDARGVLLAPLKGKQLDGELPQRILAKDLPLRRAVGHHGSSLEDWLLLAAGSPCAFRDVVIQDVYRIEQEGDYTLMVCVAIYEFAPDEESVSRIDLPPVKTKIHLRESIPRAGTSFGLVTGYVAGAALCITGVVWLLAHRRKHNAGHVSLRIAFSHGQLAGPSFKCHSVPTIDTSSGNCFLFAVVRPLPEQPSRQSCAAFLCANRENICSLARS
jgi:hypothetical protein